jgi:hypothetical protein
MTLRFAPVFVLAALSVLPGCGDPMPMRSRDAGQPPRDTGTADVGPQVDSGPTTNPCDREDTDGDGIPDALEGVGDPDMDGRPNSMDDDSDGDGVLDSEERRGRCPPANGDGDAAADFVDLDSDDDGLTDAEEATLGTDPTAVDSDGDGVSDLGEVRGSMTDPTDPSSTIPAGDFFVVLPYDGPHENRPLRFSTNIARADIYFLIDTTASMQAAIDDVNASLMTIAAEVARVVPDAQFGVGHFDDFPVAPYGDNPGEMLGFYVIPLRACFFPFECSGPGAFCASPGYCANTRSLTRDDAPYTHDQDITGDLARVNAALGLRVNAGNDIPESGTEAVYLAASGMGLTYPNTRTGTSTIPPKTCPPVAGETEPRRGYPCFRPGALPIFVTVTDAPFHNGTSATTVDWTIPYSGAVGASAHSFTQAVDALTALGARAIGVNVGTGAGGTAAGADLTQLAMRTGTVSSSGSPLVYTGTASMTADQIIAGIRSVVSGTPQDVSTRTTNVAGNPDDFDATLFIQSIVPLEGYNMGRMGPMPGITYASRDATTFYQVIPGTEVEFTVDFWNDVRMPAATAQIFRARIIVVGNGVADLDERQVYIVVPPDGGMIILE